MWSLSKLAKKIYLLEFDNNYELAMTFLRAQEFYESSNPKFRNQSFSILDYMEWYSKEHGNGSFAYAADWAGFNLPGEIIEGVFKSNPPDWNRYDEFLLSVRDLIKTDLKGYSDYYLIGAVKNDKETIEHELAHAMYRIIDAYKIEINTPIFFKRNEKMFMAIKEYLMKDGYSACVITDEHQAHMATGLTKDMKKFLKNKKFKEKEIQQEQEYYKGLFKKYRNNLDG